MKIAILILLLCTQSFATVSTFAPTADTYVYATSPTFNWGGSVEQYIGNRSGTSPQNMLVYFDLSSIPSNATINSAVCSLWCSVINNAENGFYIRLRSLDSSWVEGSADGTYQLGSCSWQNQGIGSGVGGVTIATNDSGWGLVASGTVPPAGGAWSTAGVDSEHVNSSTDSTLVFDNAAFVALIQSYVSGTKANYGFHLAGTSATSSRRIVVLSSESATTARRPNLTLDWDPPGDSTFLRIRITPPSAPLTDYPILVNFLAYPELASNSVTFYDADSTTKLYWWPDSVSGHYFRAWVVNDWAASPENIFVTHEYNPSYMNADSVFLIYENWNTPFVVSQAVTDWDNYNCTVFDTLGPIITGSTSATTYADSLIREVGPIQRDWQETDPLKRYKHFYCTDGRLTSAAALNIRYTDNILCWAYTSALGQAWTKADTVTYDSSGTPTPIRTEDPDFVWLPDLGKWLMTGENHQTSDQYHVGLFLADSLDQPLWQFSRNITLLEPSALGGPTNWLAKEQASPAFCWWHGIAGSDTLYQAFEAYDGAGTDKAYTGVAISFDGTGAYSGDTLGLDWHLLDSTGAINDANPSPMLVYTNGWPDSTKTIPDAFLYLNGEYALSNHGFGPSMSYIGTTIPDLVLESPTDSAKLAGLWLYDSTDANLLGTMFGSASGNDDSLYLARARDFSLTRFSENCNDFTLLARCSKYGSYHRFLGGEAYASSGVLSMYPSQNMTGSLSIMSKDSFNTGVVVDIWMSMTSRGDGTPYVTISLGDDTLQDNTGVGAGGALLNANWYRTSTQKGYSLYIHPTSARFYDDTTGTTAQRGIASAITLDADGDTLASMHKYTVTYTTGDSLLLETDGIRRISGKDATWNGTHKRLVISQGEEVMANRGGVLHIDSLRVRKFTNANGSAIASDTLRNNEEDVTVPQEKMWGTWGGWGNNWKGW